jgi:hypothetical protein
LPTRLLESWLRCTASSSFVLFRVGSDVFQCPLDGLRDWGWCGEVSALWDEAVLISSVGEYNASAVWSRVLVSTLGDLRFLFGIAQVLHVTFLLGLDFIGCLVAATNPSVVPLHSLVCVSDSTSYVCMSLQLVLLSTSLCNVFLTHTTAVAIIIDWSESMHISIYN